MLVAAPGSVVVCHFCPFHPVTAAWPALLIQKTSWPGEPDGSRSVAAASAAAAEVPGSSLTVHFWPDPVAVAIAPLVSTKNTLAWPDAVLLAASGVFAAAVKSPEMVLTLQPLVPCEATVSAPEVPR